MVALWKSTGKFKSKTESAMDPFQILFWHPEINCDPAVDGTQLFAP